MMRMIALACMAAALGGGVLDPRLEPSDGTCCVRLGI